MDEWRSYPPATLADHLVVGPTYEIQPDGTLVPGSWICLEHWVENCDPCSKPGFFASAAE